MLTHGERLAYAANLLSDVTETPRLDSELLLAHSLHISRAQLLARLNESGRPDAFETLLERRRTAEPLAYIFGEWEFFGLSFVCRRPVLVPRPETEHLVEAVLAFIRHSKARVLDLCTGTGCVGLSIAANAAHCEAVLSDRSKDAVALARTNAERLELTNRVSVRHGDLFDVVSPDELPFDAVCANPPYVEDSAWEGLSPVIREYEDPGALLAGPDGLDVIRKIAAEAPAYLRPGGLLALEMGAGQWDCVRAILTQHQYENIQVYTDLAGIERVVTGQKSIS